MSNNQQCPLDTPDLSKVEVIALQPEVSPQDQQEAEQLARKEAEKHFDEYMLLSWYDAERNFESPAHCSECAGDGPKKGYIHYALNRGARLMVDIEKGRFVFLFTPVEW